MFREPKPGFVEVMELVARLNPDFPSISSIEAELRKLYEQHRIDLRGELEAEGLEWEDEKGNDPWKGCITTHMRSIVTPEGGSVSQERQAGEAG